MNNIVGYISIAIMTLLFIAGLFVLRMYLAKQNSAKKERFKLAAQMSGSTALALAVLLIVPLINNALPQEQATTVTYYFTNESGETISATQNKVSLKSNRYVIIVDEVTYNIPSEKVTFYKTATKKEDSQNES